MLKIDPEFQALIPPLTSGELTQLEQNLLRDGCREPLVVWKDEGILLDGHNRHAICTKHGLSFKTAELPFPDRDAAKEWVIFNQFGRRNLNAFQRAEIALKLEPYIAARAKQQQIRKPKTQPSVRQNSDEQGLVTNRRLAKLAGLSHDTIHRVRVISQLGTDAVKDKLRRSRISIHSVYRQLRNIERKRKHAQMLLEASRGDAPLHVERRASVILADPPWEYSFANPIYIKPRYPTMGVEALCSLPVPDVCESDAILFLWSPSTMLPTALKVMEAWGFTYKTSAVWVKNRAGLGFYFRQKHELLLVGIKGQMPTPVATDRPESVIVAPRTRHSAKPEVVHDLIERMYPAYVKLELFARKPRAGFLAWGNQLA